MKNLTDLTREKREVYWADRLTAQLNFAKRLSIENNGKWQEIIEKAEEFAINAAGEKSPITPQIVMETEKMLEPLSKAAKEYKVICAAHAHIDMNWQWGWDETVGVAIDTAVTMLKLLEEYPQFKFSLSQASTYKILKDYAPEIFEEVKKYVHLGRWEVTAPSWVECDKNMPSGESLAMQVYCAKKYLAENLEIDPDTINVDFEPDTFGHSLQVPEILASAGVKYYYHCRGTNSPYTLYRWQSPSGSEILVNRENNFYSSQVNSKMGLVAIEVAKKQNLKTTLRVYGVGDHGGGPSRRDIERLLDMSQWTCFPNFVLGTYSEFFAEAEKIREQIPVVTGDINFVCDGCYTSQNKIKTHNKLCENSLYSAEALCVMAVGMGKNDGDKSFESSWQKVLLSHFHDIITGSGVEATRHHAIGEYQNVLADTVSGEKLSAKYITDNIDTTGILTEENVKVITGDFSPFAAGAGSGSLQAEKGAGTRRAYHIFNTLPTERKEVQSVMLWDFLGDADKIIVKDGDGTVVPHNVVGKGFNHYWGHNYVEIKVFVTVPPMGYMTVIVDESKEPDVNAVYWPEKRQQRREEFILENDLIRVEFNSLDGSVKSVTDVKTGEEYIDQSRKSGIFRLITEANQKELSYWDSEMSGWFVGRYKNIENLHKNCELSLETGCVSSSVTGKFSFNNSKITYTATLEKGSRTLKYTADIHWLETGSHEKGTPQLSFYMPVKGGCTEYLMDVPFGVIERKPEGYDYPASTFVCGGKTAVLSKNTYGYRCDDDSVSATLLRSSFEPDPYPELGLHKLDFALAFGDFTENLLVEISRKYNVPLNVASGYFHKGNLPLKASVLKAEGCVVSAIRKSGGSTLVRVYDVVGKNHKVSLKLDKPVSEAFLADINGNKVADVEIQGKTLSFTIGKNKIETVIFR